MRFQKIVQYFLLPLSLLYSLVTFLRNWFYDKGYFASEAFDLPVISVGNLTVGGTGKTPHVEYLIDMLGDYKISTLSRGYARNTKGYILAKNTININASTIGDEPFQYFLKYSPKVSVSVCEKRVEGVSNLLRDTSPHLIILDDAFQHRPIRPSLQILLTDSRRLFYKDFSFPAGLLREGRSGANRADIVIVSKCLDMSLDQMDGIAASIKRYTKDTPIYFSKIKYLAPKCFSKDQEIQKNVILLSGIAQPTIFEEDLKSKFTVIKHFVFKDHHEYNLSEITPIIDLAVANGANILCTEKDFVKLKTLLPKEDQPLFYYIPIKIAFLKDEEKFEELIRTHILTNKKS